jgi:hypothetical protein
LPIDALLTSPAWTAGVGEDHRQGHLAFAEVVAAVLAHVGGAGVVVDRVVDQLEGDAEVAAVRRAPAPSPRRIRRRPRRNAAGGGEQRGGLGADDLQVALLAGLDLALRGELVDLALRDDRAGRR